MKLLSSCGALKTLSSVRPRRLMGGLVFKLAVACANCGDEARGASSADR
jgi:hypothetical protein